MANPEPSPEVVFLIGAGASVEAGIPDTFRFVTEFQQSLTNNDYKATVDKIVDILETWKTSNIDVELLLETLTKLDTKAQEPLLRFY